MQPTTNTAYQGMLQRIGQLAGVTPANPQIVVSPAPIPQAPVAAAPYPGMPVAPVYAPDQIMLSSSAQAAYPTAVPQIPYATPMPGMLAPQAPMLTPYGYPAYPTAAFTNPLGVGWVDATLAVAPTLPTQPNPLGVSWLEMTIPATPPAAPETPLPQPAPKPEAKPEPKKPESKPKSKPESKPESKPKPKPVAKPKSGAKPATKSYTVRSGDSLAKIAQETLGSSGRWQEIYALNKGVIGANPNVISAGMVLKLPGAAKISKSRASKAGKVPYINQYSPAGAAGGYWNGPANCGPTSMAMIARAFGYGKSMSDAKLINHLGKIGGTSGNGTNVGGIAAMAHGIGKSATTKGPGAHVDWIASELRKGKLVVANGDYHAMAPHINNARTSGHYVAVVGLDRQGRFLVHDPAWRNGGAPIALTASQLSTFIRSNPNGGYQISIG